MATSGIDPSVWGGMSPEDIAWYQANGGVPEWNDQFISQEQALLGNATANYDAEAGGGANQAQTVTPNQTTADMLLQGWGLPTGSTMKWAPTSTGYTLQAFDPSGKPISGARTTIGYYTGSADFDHAIGLIAGGYLGGTALSGAYGSAGAVGGAGEFGATGGAATGTTEGGIGTLGGAGPAVEGGSAPLGLTGTVDAAPTVVGPTASMGAGTTSGITAGQVASGVSAVGSVGSATQGGGGGGENYSNEGHNYPTTDSTQGMGGSPVNASNLSTQFMNWLTQNPKQAMQLLGIGGGLIGKMTGSGSGSGSSGGIGSVRDQSGLTANRPQAYSRQYVAPPAGYRPGIDPEHMYFTGIGNTGGMTGAMPPAQFAPQTGPGSITGGLPMSAVLDPRTDKNIGTPVLTGGNGV